MPTVTKPDSTPFYEAHAQTFFDETIGVDMQPLYGRFLPRFPEGAHLLDAGCGSGRDARAFIEQGFRVTAFDASPALVALAQRHIGQPVHCLRFQDLTWQAAFDGIWACASLLHVPAAALPDALRRLGDALKPGGTLYASFKYGSGERDHGGRRFTDLDEAGLAALLGKLPPLRERETWITADQRPGRAAERWLNTLLSRV